MSSDSHPSATAPVSHQLAVGYLCWAFGFTGSHRFYYGKPLSGTIWFSTFGLLGIGWLIDLFLIPGMNARANVRFESGPKDYNVAWILQTWFGYLGFHRFYLGKVWTGLLWFFTGGLLTVGYLYDFWTLNEQLSDVNCALKTVDPQTAR